jgi:hypothetical protein
MVYCEVSSIVSAMFENLPGPIWPVFQSFGQIRKAFGSNPAMHLLIQYKIKAQFKNL